MSEVVSSAACSSSRDGFPGATSEPVAAQPAANPVSSGLETHANPPSPTKRRASLEPETPVAKRIKVEPSDDTSLPNPKPAETSIPASASTMMTPALPAIPAPATATAAAPSVATTMTTTTTTTSIPPTAPATTTPAAPMTSIAPSPQIAASVPAHPTPPPASSTGPIPSIEKSPSVKPEPVRDVATPNSATKDNATPETPVVNAARPATATAAPPRKRRRMTEAPGQALRGMNMQLLGIQAVQVLEWLSQEPFEDVADALRDEESEVHASYNFKVAQFEQAWRNFSPTEDLLVWSKMGLGDQKHRKTLRLANLARFAIDLFTEDESYLPSLHEKFFRVFVYGTREFLIDHSNILLELKTQLALHLLTESDGLKAPAVILQEVMLDGLEEHLSKRSWNLDKSDEEAAMLTSAEIRMSLLLQEYEESGNSATTLADRYPPDNLLRQLGSYMHKELDAHADHCQTLVFSSRTSGNRPDEPRSLAYQDDDDYWPRTANIIDEIAASITADIGAESAPATTAVPVPATSTQPSATTNGTTKSEAADAIQPAATPAASAAAAAPVTPAVPTAPTIEPREISKQLRGDIDRLKEFMNQRVAVLEAEMARASLHAAPPPTSAPLDPTAQNLYLLNKATQSQQRHYTQRTSTTPQPRTHTPAGAPHTPIPGHPHGHVPHLPHPAGNTPNHTPGQGQASNPPLAPGELPPHQTCPTSMLYDKARQAALSKSATHTRREGIHSTRRPWTPEEEKALMTGLDMVKGPHWSQILSLFGPNGTISDVLKDRTQVQLKDKARNLKLFFLKTQSEMPYYLSAVTGELKTRAPNQAARKEAEERARLSREEDQSKAQGTMAALAGQLQNSNLPQGNQGGTMRQQHHTEMVTPAQAALAAQITTPAMAQGQAQSAQRPIHTAQFPTSIAQTKEAQTMTAAPVSGTMAAPASTSAQGVTVSTPGIHSQPHNRPSDGTVAALQELAKASASPAPGMHTPRMSNQVPAQGQGQAQGASTGAYHMNQGHAAHGQSNHPIARQPQPRPQMPAQPQGQAQSQTRYSASPGLSAYAPTPSVTTPAASTAKSTPTSDAGPATTQAQTSAATPAGAAHTPTARPQGVSTSGVPQRAQQPPSSSASTTSASIPATSALAQLQHSRSTPMTLSQSFPSTIPASLFSRVTEAEATNAGLLEKLRAEMAREARS